MSNFLSAKEKQAVKDLLQRYFYGKDDYFRQAVLNNAGLKSVWKDIPPSRTPNEFVEIILSKLFNIEVTVKGKSKTALIPFLEYIEYEVSEEDQYLIKVIVEEWEKTRTPQIVPPPSPPSSTNNLRAIRQRLNNKFDDVEFDAFCLDYFTEVYDRFSRGMGKDEKITHLLDHCRREPIRWQKLLTALEKIE